MSTPREIRRWRLWLELDARVTAKKRAAAEAAKQAEADTDDTEGGER